MPVPVWGCTGNGGACPSPGPVSQCTLSTPAFLSADRSGDLLVGDELNDRVLLYGASNFNPTSHVSCASTCYVAASMVWGQRGNFNTNSVDTGGLNAGALFGPTSITFDAAGNADVCDNSNYRVLEYQELYSITARIALGTGWNWVALPSQTALTYSAALIVQQVQEEGGKVSGVASYQNGSYSVYIPEFSNDFAVDPTQGVWVLESTPSVGVDVGRVCWYVPPVAGGGMRIGGRCWGHRRSLGSRRWAR
jgi:hypothetical protein